MQEFESISASSYDPSALATKLTAKAAEGWSVVAIVPTGGDVTAFVSREKGGATESANSEESISESVALVPEIADDESPAPELAAVTEAAPEPAAEPQAEPVTEPSGWAIAPEPASTTPEPTGVQPTVGASPTSSYQPAATPTYDPLAATTPSVTTPAPAPPAEAPPAAAAPAAAAPAVPAGWYADPAGRFELRYWDGSTWTEHVSRAGQQFTDPPVA